MNPFVIFGYMVWIVFTMLAWIVGVGVTGEGISDEDGPTFFGGVFVLLIAMLSSSFLLSMLG